jgi:hypothetical protein
MLILEPVESEVALLAFLSRTRMDLEGKRAPKPWGDTEICGTHFSLNLGWMWDVGQTGVYSLNRPSVERHPREW